MKSFFSTRVTTSTHQADERPAELSEAAPLLHPPNAAIVELDVREELRAGREPFSRIMAAVSDLCDADVLLLRSTFEPVPLFKVLGKRGFAHESRAAAADDWSVWFWRPGTAETDTRETWLDVRELEPPEPMTRTLTALESLPHGHVLVQVNARVPIFLLPVLVERGFICDIDASQPGRVLMRIRHASPSIQPSGEHESMSTQSVELDVRVIPPRDKHPAIFRAFDGLESGQALVILNDHDPRPLRYQFAAERPEAFDWEYEAEGPELWRVKISRR